MFWATMSSGAAAQVDDPTHRPALHDTGQGAGRVPEQPVGPDWQLESAVGPEVVRTVPCQRCVVCASVNGVCERACAAQSLLQV